jgi:hypothetical protein
MYGDKSDYSFNFKKRAEEQGYILAITKQFYNLREKEQLSVKKFLPFISYR